MKEMDIDVIVRRLSRVGLARHYGGIYPGDFQDNKAIAAALRKIADGLEASAPERPMLCAEEKPPDK